MTKRRRSDRVTQHDPVVQRMAKFREEGYGDQAARALAELELREEAAAREEAKRKANPEEQERQRAEARARGEMFECPDCGHEHFTPQGVMPSHGRWTSDSHENLPRLWKKDETRPVKLLSACPYARTISDGHRNSQDDHLVPDDHGSCKGPPPDCRRIVIRLRYGIKGRCGRRATSTGESAWLTYTRIGP